MDLSHLSRDHFLKHVIEGKIEGRIEVTRRRGRRKQLLDDLDLLNAELNPIRHLLALVEAIFSTLVG